MEKRPWSDAITEFAKKLNLSNWVKPQNSRKFDDVGDCRRIKNLLKN